jgi:hypothetical protein
MSHASRNRNEDKSIKRDDRVRREVLNELDEVTDRDNTGREEPKYNHLNRDQARGDCDRTGRHTDEGTEL